MFAKWCEVGGIKCQGNLEARVAQLLLDRGHTHLKRGKAIPTPFGRYTPDFDLGPYFIEVKGLNTWHKAVGNVPFLEGARSEKMGEISDTSLKKMEWTNLHVKPLLVLVDTTKTRKSLLSLKSPPHNLRVVFGSTPEFVNFLKEYSI